MPGKPPISEKDMRQALAEGQFSVAYQPQVLADGSKIASVEALVRWTHPQHGSIPPVDFIPVAEKSGLIKELGAFVLRRACQDAVQWPSLTVGVNVSPYQFRDPSFVDFVRSAAEEAGLPLQRLELEITEGSYFDDFKSAEIAIERLRSLGVGIALDDFGTGYASLTYLRRLPLTKVKIDKSFVDEFQSLGSSAIIQAVVALSRALGLKVTAEGVETIEQQRFLRAAGCHYLQGYLFSLPVGADGITELLARPVHMPVPLPAAPGR